MRLALPARWLRMAGVEFAQENPLGSDEAADVISDDPESTPLLGRRVADLEARLAKHEQVLGTGGSAQSTIRGVLAHLGKTERLPPTGAPPATHA